MVFPVVMYGCEGWTIKKAERQRIDDFELLEKTLKSSLDCKEGTGKKAGFSTFLFYDGLALPWQYLHIK